MCFKSSSSQQGMGMQVQNSSQTYDPWVQTGGQDIYNKASGWLGANGYQPYSGPLTASFGEPFNQASTYLSQALGKENPYTSQAAGAVQGVIGAIDPNATTASFMSPYLQQVLAPTIQNITQAAGEQNQANNASATMQGAYGGTGAGVVKALLDKNTQQQIANATGQAYNNAWNTAQSSRLSNLQTLLGAGSGLSSIGQQAFGQGTQLASLLAGLGSTEQQAGQTGITNAMALSKERNTLPLAQYATLAQILGGVPKAQYGSSVGFNMNNSTATQPNNSAFGVGGSLLSMLRL